MTLNCIKAWTLHGYQKVVGLRAPIHRIGTTAWEHPDDLPKHHLSQKHHSIESNEQDGPNHKVQVILTYDFERSSILPILLKRSSKSSIGYVFLVFIIYRIYAFNKHRRLPNFDNTKTHLSWRVISFHKLKIFTYLILWSGMTKI